MRHTVSRDAGKIAKYKDEHDGGEDGLDDKPQGAEHRLFIDGDDVALHVHIVEVAVAPDALYVNVKPFFLGLYFDSPFVIHNN